ncbi:DUF397 domain-containing protein [Streptomyces xiamenensis]|uniref:DUF397 domain-containing protein n=1 Tax=Streptomyces xiamenensis TaxID=408015 RepID=UPI0036E10E03
MTTESPRWFTSSYSSNGGQCVEVAPNLAASQGVIPIRDSKLQDHGPVVTYSTTAWSAFVDSLKR